MLQPDFDLCVLYVRKDDREKLDERRDEKVREERVREKLNEKRKDTRRGGKEILV